MSGAYTTSNYSWTYPNTIFANFDPALASNQYVQLPTADTTSALSFYGSESQVVNLQCTAQVLTPNNQTFNVTGTADPIAIECPAANWPAAGQFGDQSPNDYVGNEVWSDVTITVPSQFTGGEGAFLQIVTPGVTTVTRVPVGGKPAQYSIKVPDGKGGWIAPGVGLDGAFPYKYGYTTDSTGNPVNPVTSGYTFTAGTYGYSGDAPSGSEGGVPDVDGGGTDWISSTAADSFKTYLMYKPPAVGSNNVIWVPLESLQWSWSGSAKVSSNVWSANGSVSTPATGSVETTFPTWTSVISGQQYRP